MGGVARHMGVERCVLVGVCKSSLMFVSAFSLKNKKWTERRFEALRAKQLFALGNEWM